MILLTIAMSLMTGISREIHRYYFLYIIYLYLHNSAVITCYYSTSAVLQAFGTTAGIVLTVTGLTFWSKFDITKVSFVCHRYSYKSFV